MNTTLRQDNSLARFFNGLGLRRGAAFGIIILMALLFFEIFNYSTTDFALKDLLGDLKFAGLRWATILAIAFCGIDFAGIARLFTPQQGADEPTEVWYLFGAWLLAATMNAILTWWGVSMAIVNHQVQSSAVLSQGILTKIVPVFVAVMVWVIRILIIGSLSTMGDRMFRTDQPRLTSRPQTAVRTINGATANPISIASSTLSPRPAPKPVLRPDAGFNRPEPTYHSVSTSPRSANNSYQAKNAPPAHETRR